MRIAFFHLPTPFSPFDAIIEQLIFLGRKFLQICEPTEVTCNNMYENVMDVPSKLFIEIYYISCEFVIRIPAIHGAKKQWYFTFCSIFFLKFSRKVRWHAVYHVLTNFDEIWHHV